MLGTVAELYPAGENSGYVMVQGEGDRLHPVPANLLERGMNENQLSATFDQNTFQQSPSFAEAFRAAGHELRHVGLEKGATVRGKKQETPVTIDAAVGEDGNLISSRNPNDIPDFIEASPAKLS